MTLLTAKSAQEFSTVRRRAFIDEWRSFLTGRPSDLLSFEEVKRNLRLQNSAYKGLQEIELNKIVGSTGRYRDFTRSFLPKTDSTEQRWRVIDSLAQEQGFPPIEVYQVGEVYFVRDGNHRVSVAKAHNVRYIEAYVVEYKTSVPVTLDDDLDAIFLKLERTNFFEETRLDHLRPDQTLEFTEPGRYQLMREHIAFHKYLKETEFNRELSDEEAVTSWYDTVYLPAMQFIRERGVLKTFPGRTEADLYAWLTLHRATIERETEAFGFVSEADVVDEVTTEKTSNPLVRWISYLRTRFNGKRLRRNVAHAKFIAESRLDELRPDHTICLSDVSSYRTLREHISMHKYFIEIEQNREISTEEAMASWYDNVYQPVVALIRERSAMQHFPASTEADLYLAVVARRAQLERERNAFGSVSNEHAIDALQQQTTSENPLARMIQLARSRLGWGSVPLS